MKKQNYSTFTSYLSKTHKNVDLYRLYNPHFSSFCKSYTYDHDFYLTYFSRHMITERNILTIFSNILNLRSLLLWHDQERNDQRFHTVS